MDYVVDALRCVAVVGILDIAKCLYEAITKIEQEYNAHSKSLEEGRQKGTVLSSIE